MIEFINVTKKYFLKTILKNINFKIKDGTINLLIGENGSGKSTILKLISKTIYPSSGKIYVNNKCVYIQEKYNLPRHINSYDYINFLERINYIDLSYYVKLFDIPNLEIKKLSKGNLQKLSLISAIASKASIILLDEPTEGMDKNMKEKYLKEIVKLEKKGKTIVISTHDILDYSMMKTNTLYLSGGNLIEGDNWIL